MSKSGNRVHLTQQKIDRHVYRGPKFEDLIDQRVGSDSYVPGFRVRFYATGARTFYVRANGKLEKIGSADSMSLADAKLEAAEMLNRAQVGELPKIMKLGQAIDQFMASYVTERGGKSINEDSGWICYMGKLKELCGSMKFDAVTHATLQAIVNEMTGGAAKRAKSNWRVFFTYAQQNRWMDASILNPANNLRINHLEKSHTKSKRELTEPEMLELFSASQSHANKLLFPWMWLLAETGCRPGEPFKLSWKDASELGQIFVSADIDKRGEEKFYPPKATQGCRDAIKALRAAWTEVVGREPKPDDQLIPGSRSLFAGHMKQTQQKHNLDTTIKPSHFRSTVITRIFKVGREAGMKELAKNSPHVDVKTSMRYYVAEAQ